MPDPIALSRRTVVAGLAATMLGGRPLLAVETNVPPNLAAIVNEFGGGVLRGLHRAASKKNVAVAPFDLHSALTLLAAGANEVTLAWLLNTSAFRSDSLADLLQQSASLSALVGNAAPGVELRTSSSVWTKLDSALLPTYVERTKGTLDGPGRTLDFANPAAAATINKWAAEATGGRITQIVDRTDARTQLVIATAMFFKGLWARPFDAKDTVDTPFSLSEGGRVSVPMMRGDLRGGYWENATYRAAALPYGRGDFEFIVLQPRNARTAPAFRRFNLGQVLKSAQFAAATLELGLPRFKLSFSDDMRATLSGVGLGRALSDTAVYSGITGHDIGKPQVVHAVDLTVDETGTEAAAATAVTGTRSAEQPVKFTLDRPFAFAISSKRAGLHLVQGIVTNPLVT